MPRVAIIGSGKIGEMICNFLIDSGDYHVTLIDISQNQLGRIPKQPQLNKHCQDVTDVNALAETLEGHFAVISAGPYYLSVPVARSAAQARVHYLDLSEDIASTRQVKHLSEGADTAFIPQCGLAPGFVSIVANDIAQGFDELDTVSLRVGALPEYPTNSLGYNLTWSTEGLINEYSRPCIAVINGQLTEVQPLEQREEFWLDGVNYESFNTSGGLGTLSDTLHGKVKNLYYQTIRYPGHRDIMRTLLKDLRLAERKDVLRDILEHALPGTYQDMVLIFVSVSGTKEKRLLQETYANKICSRAVNGRSFGAIQVTTAAGICAMLDLLCQGKLPQAGFIRQEQVCLHDFLDNRFGSNFQRHSSEASLGRTPYARYDQP